MPNFFQIHTIQEEDHEQLVNLWKTCGLVVAWNDPSKDILRKVSRDPDGLLIGWFEQKLVASVMVGYAGHRGWINYLAVDPQFRQQGFGRKMMEAAEKYLLNLVYPKINLQIRASNQEVIEFYLNQGFLKDDVINMGKRLIPDYCVILAQLSDLSRH